MSLENTIEKHALANALKYNGKANPGSVISKVIGEHPEAKKDMKSVSKQIQDAIKKINSMSVAEQEKTLQEKYPEMLEEKPKEEHDLFAFLKIAPGTKVVTAFPPEPSKYPHIGHAKACLLNYELAKRCQGKFILHFEDTNPELAKLEFYDIIQENLKWLGIQWDQVYYISDMMDQIYEQAEKLIQKGLAYVCTCPSEKIKEHRMKGTGCDHRSQSGEQTLNEWKKMFTSSESGQILRAKTASDHANSAMRDPALFRINKTPHCRTGTKYSVWPMYDFQSPIIDALTGITHRLRSKEFELRSELHRWLQQQLGFPITETYEFARFSMTGVETSGRVIREKIASGEYLGWDDPSLVTLVALRRRGFVPEGIHNFVFNTGISKSDSTLTWDDLETQNRRILDKEANRYFFICTPVKIEIQSAPTQRIELDLHPDKKNGGRSFQTNTTFYLAKQDVDKLQEDKLYRLMDCLNFVKKGNQYIYQAGGIEEYRKNGAGILHWLPCDEQQLVSVEVLKPTKELEKGYAEKTIQALTVGSVVQFTRYGFCRLDGRKMDQLSFWYTHR
ncbi:MAG: glutamate--tRNA ligase [Nanoarchaeota archaeon]